MSFKDMQDKPKIIWAFTGNNDRKSHYLDRIISGRRYSICGRVIQNTGDDAACPHNEPCECKTCNRLAEREYWRYPK